MKLHDYTLYCFYAYAEHRGCRVVQLGLPRRARRGPCHTRLDYWDHAGPYMGIHVLTRLYREGNASKPLGALCRGQRLPSTEKHRDRNSFQRHCTSKGTAHSRVNQTTTTMSPCFQIPAPNSRNAAPLACLTLSCLTLPLAASTKLVHTKSHTPHTTLCHTKRHIRSHHITMIGCSGGLVDLSTAISHLTPFRHLQPWFLAIYTLPSPALIHLISLSSHHLCST